MKDDGYPRPQKFNDRIVIYDDGDICLAYGTYDGDEKKCVGIRWNHGKSEKGFPVQGQHPYFVVLPFYIGDILLKGIYEDGGLEKYMLKNDEGKVLFQFALEHFRLI